MRKKLFPGIVAASLSFACLLSQASALDYTYESNGNGDNFYTSTTKTEDYGEDYIANSGKIVVGVDGTIGINQDAGNVSSSPLSVLDLPVGEIPDSWGKSTEIAIAQATMHPNEVSPNTQMSGIPGLHQFETAQVGSNALPTGASELYNTTYAPRNSLATSLAAIEPMNSSGAIGRLSIPALGISQYVYEGTSNASMRKGLAHFDCTPGWYGNIALAGHNRGSYAHFGPLKNAQVGQSVSYATAYGTRNYQITYVGSCSTTDVSGLLQKNVNTITMYTCIANQPNVKLMVVATAM